MNMNIKGLRKCDIRRVDNYKNVEIPMAQEVVNSGNCKSRIYTYNDSSNARFRKTIGIHFPFSRKRLNSQDEGVML
jgi:hypothetical protein